MSYLKSLPGAVPVLQIIHISDLHVVATDHFAAQIVRRYEKVTKRIGLIGLWQKFRDGTAPSDPFAPIVFADFIQRITVLDPVWSAYVTWIVDTGDQTTFGDDASFSLARSYLSSFLGATGTNPLNKALVNLYGNHDAWPEDVPLFAGKRIPHHTSAIGGLPFKYAVGTAQAPFSISLPGNGEIQLYTVDTVNDDPWQNFWARGRVETTQLNDLYALMQSQQKDASTRNFRILATHHPVHFPPPRPGYQMVIANEDGVRKRLSTNSPLVHLVLSGHDHRLYPEHSDLPHSPRVCRSCTLGNDQCQMLVGSLMQIDRFGVRKNHPHQCQVLRFYQDPAKPEVVVLERILAARNPYDKSSRIDYNFVPITDNGNVAEEIVIAL